MTLFAVTIALPAAAQTPERSLDAGAGWLIDGASELSDDVYQEQVDELLAGDAVRRAVEVRQRLYRDRYLTPLDDRSRTLFLRGEPAEITPVECGFVFQPLEIWRYGEGEPRLIFHRDDTGLYHLWLPTDGKPMLYTDEMRYYLEQWEQFKGRIQGKRFDKRTCEAWEVVDEATGVDGLYKARKNRPTDEDILAMVESPADAGAWAGAVDEAAGLDLAGASLRLYFPELRRQRMETLFIVDLPADAGVEPTVEPDDVEAALGPDSEADGEEAESGESEAGDGAEVADSEPSTNASDADADGQATDDADQAPTVAPNQVIEPELRVVVEGLLEQDGAVFERFRFRFRHPLGEVDERVDDREGLHLSFSEPLRPGYGYTTRLRVEDPTSGRRAYLERTFEVPRLPVEAPVDDYSTLLSTRPTAVEQVVAERVLSDARLYLVPPAEEVVFGVLRTEAVVVGEVAEVRFLVDGQQQFTRTRPPFTAEVNLSDVPRQQVIRAEAYDAEGALMASDEIVVNQPRGVFSVRIVEPTPTSVAVGGRNTVKAAVTLPPERRLEKVEFTLDDEVFASRTTPPWEAEFTAPPAGVVAYLAVTATLTNGARVEDVLFLNAPQILEEVDVQLVELLTTVVDGNGRPVTGVAAEDFEIYDNGRLQKLQKFEVVENLPLTLGFAVDTSSSMKNALPEAKRAVVGFLDNTVPHDRVFSIAFSHETRVLTPPTDDFDLVRRTLEDLVSYGGTALHDALVTSLFFARGFEGRKVLVLLSDGEDTASRIDFDTAMHYAQASGTVIYTVGLKITDGTFRRQLARLATETGGRAYTISEAAELEGVYQEIADELRKQVLLAYAPSPPGEPGEFHEVEVKVKGRGLEARTIGGYVR